MKRSKPLPDNRLDWRDPDMPVLDDGIEKTPEQFQKARIRYLEATQGPIASRHFPHYKNDPSYNWNRRNKKNE